MLKIISADERLATAHTRNTIAVFGEYGVGKTSLLYTLPEAETLALDFEGGFKSVQTWKGDSIEIRTIEDAADIACLVGGANPALKPHERYSQAHYDHVVSVYPFDMARYKFIFFDSISVLTNVAATKARQNNYVRDKKTGGILVDANGEYLVDTRGMYGDLARDTLDMLRHMQHAEGKTVIFVGRLEKIENEAHQEIWAPQMDGQKVGRELPGIVDQVVSMSFFDYIEGTGWIHNPGKGKFRAFCCTKQNPWGLPAKERTLGNVEMIEEPHLGRLIAKINAPAAAEAAGRLSYGRKP